MLTRWPPSRRPPVPGAPPRPPTRAARASGRRTAAAPAAGSVPVQRHHRARGAGHPGPVPWLPASSDLADPRSGRQPASSCSETRRDHRRRLAARAVDRRVLRLGRGGQDDQAAAVALEGGPPGPPGLRRHHRPGPAAGRRPGPRRSDQHARPRSRDVARRAVGPHARPQGHLRRPRPPVRRAIAEQAEGILANRIYRNLTGALSGTQEYMAMEKLYELVRGGRLRPDRGGHPPDPQRPRLPRRPPAAHPVPREPAVPGADDADPRLAPGLGVAAQALLRTISKVAGAEIVHDAVTFFQAFEGMEEGFRARAGASTRPAGRSEHRISAGGLPAS